MSQCVLFCDDALARLEQLAQTQPGRFKVIFTDPPFGSTQSTWDRPLPMDRVWPLLSDLLAPRGVVVLMADDQYSAPLQLSNRGWFRYKWYWTKNKATGGFNAHRQPLQNVEELLVFAPPGATDYQPQMSLGHRPMNDCTRVARDEGMYGRQRQHKNARAGRTDRHPNRVLSFPVVNNDSPDRIHKNQKPPELAELLARSYGRPGEWLLDFTAGSCAAAIGAARAGLNFAGIENDPVMVGRALELVHRHVPDTTLYRH